MFSDDETMVIHRRLATVIMMASYRFGPDHDLVQKAIDEANRVSVMMTTARAALNRIRRN